jgi:hypothetical protein
MTKYVQIGQETLVISLPSDRYAINSILDRMVQTLEIAKLNWLRQLILLTSNS